MGIESGIGIATPIHKHKLYWDVQFLKDYPNNITCLNGYDIANCKHGLSNGFHESKIYVAQTIYAIDAINGKTWKQKSRRFLNAAIHCNICRDTIE